MFHMKILLAFLCMATAWPELVLRRRAFPMSPSPDAIAWNGGLTWYHNMKNHAAETVRADCSYWAKTFCFIILVQFALILVGA